MFNELFDAILGLGVGGVSDVSTYPMLIQYARELWEHFAASTILDWMLDTLELAVVHPCPNVEARLGLFQAVLDKCQQFIRRIEPEQRELLRSIAEDISQVPLFDEYMPATQAPTPIVDDPFSELASKSVAVYTLTESAARQFKRILEERSPGVRISLCHDIDASMRLRQLARQADLFLVATASSTHAATGCIDASRPSTLPTVRIGGKGSASMLRAVRGYLSGS